MFSKRAILLAGAMVALGGCATTDPVTGSVDRHFGEAVAWNKAVQVLNPDGTPAAPGAAEPGASGDVAAGAAQRYRSGTVKPLERVTTSQTQSGGSGAGPSGPR